jgi:phosphoenolpyruvate carboxylase
LSLPQGTFNGNLRLTEQGEVLADRYDDPAIAHRHLEQVVWSSLLAAGSPRQEDSASWHQTMATIAEASFGKYRELLEQPGFVAFFRRVTPISEIEQLPIGSRPSRRKPDGGLSDLRAIPWVFSWTQSRCLLPAWYGIGAAMGSMVDDPKQLAELQDMYSQWPFFRALVDNAELALAKSDLQIASEYAQLADDEGPNKESHRKIGAMVEADFHESTRVVLAMTQQKALLDGTPWLQESIRVRNRFIDPINLIQVELLRRGQSEQIESPEELRHLTRLSINGIAAGMRTSG